MIFWKLSDHKTQETNPNEDEKDKVINHSYLMKGIVNSINAKN